MKVLLVYPVPPPQHQILRFQQGLGSISAVLKQAGHATRLLYVWQSGVALDQALREFAPDLVAVSLTSGYLATGQAIARQAAAARIPVVFGGIHPTVRPEESIAAEGVLALCIGEGEYPLRDLCAALEAGRDPTRIANLWVKHNGTIHRNAIRPLIDPLDELPFPDREIFPYAELLRTLPEMEFMGSRGCPYPCAYCANHALAALYRGHGPYVRYRSVDHLLNEISAVLARYPQAAWLGFHDDTFTLQAAWLEEFADKFPRRVGRPFWCNSTAGRITPETVACLQRAGCYEVRIGVESGNDHIRREVLRKSATRADMVRAARRLHDAGIDVYSFNMIGLPFETRATIKDTVRLNHEIRPDEVFCSVFQPYPGTELYDLCRERGWLTGQSTGSYFENEYVLSQPGISRQDVLYYQDVFKDLVRWPWADPLIRQLCRVPLGGGKNLWNLVRRLRAKRRQFWQWIRRPTPRRQLVPPPAAKPPATSG